MMGRNEIRLRRDRMSSGHIARHRNYDELMERHQRHLRIRRIAVACIYIILLISLLAIFIVSKQKKHNPPGKPSTTTALLQVNGECQMVNEVPSPRL